MIFKVATLKNIRFIPSFRRFGISFNLLIITVILSSLFGCSVKELPSIVYPKAVYPISYYPIGTASDGLQVALVPFEAGKNIYDDPKKPAGKEAIDQAIDVLDAGVFPVRLIVVNQTNSEIIMDPEQITGHTGKLSYRNYTSQEAVELVVNSPTFKKAIRGSHVGPLVKSILGGDIIVGAARQGVGGVASGGATGGISGAGKGAANVGLKKAFAFEEGLVRLISKEYDRTRFKKHTLYPGFTSDGVIFLPSNVGIKELHLQAYDLKLNKVISLRINLKTE